MKHQLLANRETLLLDIDVRLTNYPAQNKASETDFLENDILHGIPHRRVSIAVDRALDFEPRPSIITWYSNETSWEEMQKILEWHRPRILMHFSDEWGLMSPEQLTIYDYAVLNLRHYRICHYQIDHKVTYLPVYYMSGMTNGTYTLCPSFRRRLTAPSKRKYKWGFVGVAKQDIHEMVAEFEKLVPNKIIVGEKGTKSTAETRDIYEKSVFVLCRRGNVLLCTGRIAEAVICGAIPVIVGPKNELAKEFKYERDTGWIFADSWSDARNQCRELLKSPNSLASRQESVLSWWERRIVEIQTKIREVLSIRSLVRSE